jgi:hypothetical protein
MKKTLLTLALLVSIGCWAQNTKSKSKPFAQFGIKGGMNLADVKTDLYPNHDFKLDFHAGLLAHIHLNTHLALQPEVVYSRQGFKQQQTSNREIDMKMAYVNIPVLVQYMYRGFRLETGPQIGFLVNAKAKANTGEEYNNMKDYLKSTDFSWAVGASYLSALGAGIFARYNFGISNINKNIRVTGIQNNEMNNRVWQFGLLYQFSR